MDLYFNSFQKLKYLPELTNKEIKASPNDIRSIQIRDLDIAILKSLLFIVLIFFHILLIISLYNNNINVIIIDSLLLMERISFGVSFLSVLFNRYKIL